MLLDHLPHAVQAGPRVRRDGFLVIGGSLIKGPWCSHRGWRGSEHVTREAAGGLGFLLSRDLEEQEEGALTSLLRESLGRAAWPLALPRGT